MGKNDSSVKMRRKNQRRKLKARQKRKTEATVKERRG